MSFISLFLSFTDDLLKGTVKSLNYTALY